MVGVVMGVVGVQRDALPRLAVWVQRAALLLPEHDADVGA
jgi:hypothetical protein